MIFSNLLLAAVSSVATSSAPKVSLKVEHCDLGERYQFQDAGCRFKLLNNGNESLRIRNIRTQGAGDTVSHTDLVLPARSNAGIDFSMNVGDRIGGIVRFVSFDVGDESRKMIARGFVVSDLDDATQVLDFGTVNAELGSDTHALTLTSHAVEDFRIDHIMSMPDWVEARILPDGHTVSARVKRGAPWSPQVGKIKLAVDLPHQKEAWISVAANLQGEVVPNSNPYEIGPVREGTEAEFIVRLTSRNGEPFKVGGASVRGVEATSNVQACAPAEEGCRQIKTVLARNANLGPFRGTLEVELPEFNKTIPVTFGGMIIKRSTIVKKAPDAKVPASSRTVDSTASTTPASPPQPKVDMSAALRNAVLQNQAQSTPPPGSGPLLKWQVANEHQVHGYHIYRADKEEGPFVRINDETIRVESDGTGWTYQWRDNGARPGATYWYYVGVVNTAGKVEPLSSAQKFVAK